MILTKKSRRFFYTRFQEVVILEIYLDVIFLENFLMDYILLLLTGKILHKQKKRLGIIAAASLGSAYTLLYYFLPIVPLIVFQIGNLLIVYVMACLAYKREDTRQGVICAMTMTAVSFVTGGILTWMETFVPDVLTQRTYIMMLAGALLFGYLFLQRWTAGIRERLFRKKCHLPVHIRIGEKEIHCRGLLDSGNSLYEPITKRPVVIVEEALLQSNGIAVTEGFFAIPYHAIGTQKGILKGVLADELELPEQQGEKWHKVMLGIYEGKISQKDEYQVILHPKL